MTRDEKIWLCGIQGILEETLWELQHIEGRAVHAICHAEIGVKMALERIEQKTGLRSIVEGKNGSTNY